MMLKASCVHKNTPVKLILTTSIHCSYVSSSRDTPGAFVPALLNNRSRRPYLLCVVLNSSWTDTGSPTLVGIAIAFPPKASISEATSFSGSGLLPANINVHPSAASATDQAFPTPDPAPVTIAILSVLVI